MEEMSTHPAEDALWLIGFYLQADTERPDVYTLIISGDKDRPLVSDGYVVFFTEPELAFKAVRMSSNDPKPPTSLPREVGLDCYVASSLYLIDHENLDPSATILNFLNTLFDLVEATQLPMPAEHKRVLYAFADHLTFDREFSAFFAQYAISRSAIIDAILWCIGAVVAKSKLLTHAD